MKSTNHINKATTKNNNLPLASLFFQPKLTVNQPNDMYEREADAMAEKIMRMPANTNVGFFSPKPVPVSVLQRKCTHCDEEEKYIQRTSEATRDGEIIDPSFVHKAIASGGQPLDAGTRTFMESGFGYDFGNVKVHNDSLAHQSSAAVNAFAYTHGNHIVFGAGSYQPQSNKGKHLLAHELTHVIQQGNGTGSVPPVQRFAFLEAGKIHKTNNLADTVLNGKDVGLTFALMNGKKINSGGDMLKALNKPTIHFSAVKAGGFEAKVQTVPENKFSYDETVLSPGNWKLNVHSSQVLSAFPDLSACDRKGNTIFQALGKPSDVDMFEASQRHEDKHRDDFMGIFMGTVYPWDTELSVAAAGSLAAATPYAGKTKKEAEAELYKAMGGTPDEIADAYIDAAAKAIDDYHNTAAGGPVTWDSTTATADVNCKTASVECTNPS